MRIMENKTITITRSQLQDAIAKACENFEKKAGIAGISESPKLAVMLLQNLMFGIEISKVLFGTENENKGEE